jgi:hypothetical protein
MGRVRSSRDFGARAVALIGVLLGALALIAAARASDPGSEGRSSEAVRSRALAGRITTFQASRLEQASINWRGGPITTTTGETVSVFVSDSLAPETVTPEGWAEFLVKLVHGSELSRLAMYIAPLSEVRELCGGQSLGCYMRNRAVAVGEMLGDGTTPEEVVRHEYGHHVALYRSNAPWAAIDWGPKYWASAADVCARVSRREAHPGNEGDNYAQNPGEAWAEVYRLMDERKAGILTARWPIIAPSFYPTEAALQAAERDVLQPWTAGQRSVVRRTVRKGKTWWIPLSTPVDGSVSIIATFPKTGRHAAALVGANRRTVIMRGSVAGQRVRALSATICGQRSVFVRVTQKGTSGVVRVAASTP